MGYIMNNKTKNFSFDTEETNLFEKDTKKDMKKSGGRPKKTEDKKFTKQYSIKFTEAENEILKKEYEEKHYMFPSFSSYLRYKLLYSKNIIINDS